MDINKKIEENMGFIVLIVNKFNPRTNEERERYIQAGRIGFWKAINKHKPELGALNTIAWNRIRWEIINEIKQHAGKHAKSKESISTFTNSSSISEPSYTSPEYLWEYETNKLTKEEHEVLKLRVEGYSFRDIKDHIGCSSSYIYNIFGNAIKKIKEANNGEA